VTNNDPKDFSKLENNFDVIVVDAPCSGSGLFRRDPDAINEWSENNVQLCSQRQQRILADVWPALKKDGILIYSTCSYSKEEDEDIADWITDKLPTANCQLKIEKNWSIIESVSEKGNFGYRFWPDKIKGEGFFLACFQKKDGEENADIRYRRKPEEATKVEMEMIGEWVKVGGKKFIKYKNTVYAWPENLVKDFSILLEQLHVIYSGVLTGELMRNKMVPDHALAMSTIMADAIQRTEVDFENAIKYLQRKELNVEIDHKGWQLITYQTHPLGWINSLSNRINNYYPKELRILKDNFGA
jgi:NOL1/NOP2/fmu family ribosome biogenesis protein